MVAMCRRHGVEEVALDGRPPKKPRKEGYAPAAGAWPEQKPPPENENHNPFAKRKVALLLAYNLFAFTLALALGAASALRVGPGVCGR